MSLGANLGPVNAVVANYVNATGTEKSTVVGGSTKLGGTQLFYSHSDNHSATVGETKKGDLVGLAQGFGAYTAKASYGRTNTEVKAYNVGVDYNFSKRTAVGVAYRVVDLTGTTNDIKQLGVGITHRKISDPQLAAKTLVEKGLPEEQLWEPRKLKSIAALEKMAPTKGQVISWLGALVVKPEGSPKLVRLKDSTAKGDFE